MWKLKRIRNEYPLTYFRYSIFEFKIIETEKMKGINFVLFNILLKIRVKKRC